VTPGALSVLKRALLVLRACATTDVACATCMGAPAGDRLCLLHEAEREITAADAVVTLFAETPPREYVAIRGAELRQSVGDDRGVVLRLPEDVAVSIDGVAARLIGDLARGPRPHPVESRRFPVRAAR
jgi:hypothetical protein